MTKTIKPRALKYTQIVNDYVDMHGRCSNDSLCEVFEMNSLTFFVHKMIPHVLATLNEVICIIRLSGQALYSTHPSCLMLVSLLLM